ncbi:MAG: MraY family glycosyltransferase, partial [Candidatus Binatia bacterium]
AAAAGERRRGAAESLMPRAAAAFVVALLLSLYTTPLMRKAAFQFGILDRPNGSLKTQTEAVPYLGGLAVFLAYLIALAVTFDFGHPVLGILLAGTLMLLLGLIDDLGVLSPFEKLSGQLVAVIALMKAGIFIKLLFLPWPVALVLTVLWLLTVTNALNILDIMDGLASGVAAIAALILAAVATRNDEPMIAVMAAALSGALFGFLRYNFRPARIYLGDSGSLFIGLTLSSLAMNGHYTTHNPVGMVVPVMILGVPLLDLGFVFLVRLKRGLSPFHGSPDHLPLRLRRLGWSVERIAGAAYATGGVLGLAAFGVMETASSVLAAAIVVSSSAALAAAAFLVWSRTS